MREIRTQDLAKLMKRRDDFVIIDVREAVEVAAGKIPQAIHIPLSSLPNRVRELDKNKEYFIVCRSGNRSFHATMFLSSLGFNATNMAGGMIEWRGEVVRAVS